MQSSDLRMGSPTPPEAEGTHRSALVGTICGELDHGGLVLVSAPVCAGLSGLLRTVWSADRCGAALYVSRGSVGKSDSIRLSETGPGAWSRTGTAAWATETVRSMQGPGTTGPISAVIVDDLTQVTPEDTIDLLDAVLGLHAMGCGVCIGWQPVLVEPVTRDLLHALPEHLRIQLGVADEREIGEVLAESLAPLPPVDRALIVAAVGANLSRAKAVRMQFELRDGSAGTLFRELLGALRTHIGQQVAGVLRQQPDVGQALALHVLLWPGAGAGAAARSAGIAADAVRRAERAAEELRLLPEQEPVAHFLRSAVYDACLDTLGCEARDRLAAACRRVRASPERMLEIQTALHQHDRSYFDMALRMVDRARATGDYRSLGSLADHLIHAADDPRQIVWAQQVQLEDARLTKWQAAAGLLQARLTTADELSASELTELATQMPPLFALEHPRLMQRIFIAVANRPGGVPADASGYRAAVGMMLTDHCQADRSAHAAARRALDEAGDAAPPDVHLARLAIEVMRGTCDAGEVVELVSDLSIDFSRLSARRELLFGAAARLGLGYPESAHALSLLAATEVDHARDVPERAMALLVDAQTHLRQRRFAGAMDLAAQSAAVFDSIGAGRLAACARVAQSDAQLHLTGPAEIDCSGWIGLLTDDDAHSAIRAYGTMMRARILLAEGTDLHHAVELCLQAGQHVQRSEIGNPLLLDWLGLLTRVLQPLQERELSAWAASERQTLLADWIQRTGRDDPSDPSAAGKPPLALTDAEQRVVSIVLQGKTNRQVAADLFLSKRTVDTHLRNVYRKLSIGSRSELLRFYGSTGTGEF